MILCDVRREPKARFTLQTWPDNPNISKNRILILEYLVQRSDVDLRLRARNVSSESARRRGWHI